MKRLVCLFVALVALLSGATKLNLIDIRPLANAPTVPYLVAFSSTAGWIPVIADPGGSIVLDTSGGVAILKASGASVSQPVDVSDDLVMAGSATFTTSAIPRGIVRVYRNGLLQRVTADYTVSGASGALQTIGLSGATQGDYVTLAYQK